MKLYGHNRANRRSAFIFALHCKKVWRLLIRGAPGVTYKGDGVTYKGDGLLIRRGPPFEWVSRTELEWPKARYYDSYGVFLGRTRTLLQDKKKIDCNHKLNDKKIN